MVTPQLLVRHRRGRLAFDPRTKLLFLVVSNALLMGGHSRGIIVPLAVIVTALVLVDCGVAAAACVFGVTALCQAVVQLPHLWPNWFSVAVATIGYWVLRFFLSMSVAFWVVVTTRVSDCVEALHRMRVPKSFIITVSVMLRFFPVVISEFRGVLEAMKLRGFTGARLWLHPVTVAENIVVPMLTAIARIADELAAAALIRGLGAPGRPTSMGYSGFSPVDAVLVAFVAAFIGAAFWPSLGVAA